MTACHRPLLRWHGGKWLLAPWVISHLPPHRAYVEPYGGAASVLIRKPRSYAEVWNDLDGELVNLFAVLGDDALAARLVRALYLTPFSRAVFEAAYTPAADPLDRARATIVRSFMGFGGDATAGLYRTGFRACVTRSCTTPATDWTGFPPALAAIVERLRGVVFESRPALEVMRRFDGPDTVHYVDPPYLHSTRSRGSRRRGQGFHVYAHELDTAEHLDLLAVVRELRGMVVLSGYRSSLYDSALDDWRRVERTAHADGARPRVEVLWLNPAAVAALPERQLDFAA